MGKSNGWILKRLVTLRKAWLSQWCLYKQILVYTDNRGINKVHHEPCLKILLHAKVGLSLSLWLWRQKAHQVAKLNLFIIQRENIFNLL